MSAVRLALLDASHDDENTPRNFRRELDADLVEFDVCAGQLPATFAFDGCIVTGSRSSVYWDEEWIDPLKAWIAEAIEREIPFLGICYGHQLLADVLGGTVEGMGEYELGYREIGHSGDSPLFAGIDEQFVAFTSHSDRVADLPLGAERLAENDYGNHGFRLDHVFGVQFHPEYDMMTAESITAEKEIPADEKQAVLDGITPENYEAACQAKLVFENFVAYVREHRQPQTVAE